MTPANPRNARTAWTAGCLWLALILSSCVSQSTVPREGMAQPPLGLYRVVERDCSYPSKVPEDCTRTQYVELAKGVFRGLDKDEIGLATWLSNDPEQEHVFNIRDLRQGKFAGDREYIIEDGPLGKEWFVVSDGTITDYFFVRHARSTPAGDMAGKTHLTLRPVARTDKINRLLHYPSEDE